MTPIVDDLLRGFDLRRIMFLMSDAAGTASEPRGGRA